MPEMDEREVSVAVGAAVGHGPLPELQVLPAPPHELFVEPADIEERLCRGGHAAAVEVLRHAGNDVGAHRAAREQGAGVFLGDIENESLGIDEAPALAYTCRDLGAVARGHEQVVVVKDENAAARDGSARVEGRGATVWEGRVDGRVEVAHPTRKRRLDLRSRRLL